MPSIRINGALEGEIYHPQGPINAFLERVLGRGYFATNMIGFSTLTCLSGICTIYLLTADQAVSQFCVCS